MIDGSYYTGRHMVRLCNIPTCVNCISQSCKPGQITVRTPTATARQASFEFGARSSEFQVIVEFSVRGPSLALCLRLCLCLSRSFSHSFLSSVFFAGKYLAFLVCAKPFFWSPDATGTAHPCVVRWALHPILRDLVPWTNMSAVWPQLSRSWYVLQPVNC